MNIEKSEYKEFIKTVKQKIQSSQIKASIKVNVELLKLYWDIAEMIVEKQKVTSWGDGVIKDISRDLKKEFPNMKGFSKRNIFYMKQWYLFFSKVQQVVAQLENENHPQPIEPIFQIPWGHNIAIITKIKDIEIAKFYIELNVGDKKFKIDLLFYHVKLYCYVVVELKAVDFKPEFAGKLNFYISAIDGEVKGERDNPTIGILICKSKNDTIVEYALKDINKPMGVSEYQLTQVLPKEFKSSLPTVEEIEEEFEEIKKN